MTTTYYNIVAKQADKPYIIYDMMATRLSRKQFEKIKSLNPDLLGEYHFIPYNETDFSWWGKVQKYLTNRRITTAYFDCDYWGRITKY